MFTTNLRNHSESDGFVVVGAPVAVGHVPAGHRVVLVDGDRYLTVCDGVLWCGGTSLAAVPGTLVGVHRVGAFVVVAGTAGVVYLTDSGGTLVVADIADALPALTFTQQSAATLTVAVPALAFATPYTRWQAPLQQSDVAALTATLRTCWNTLTAQAHAAGVRYAPCRFRCGVRLWDDSYLWMSDPVELGSLPADVARVTVSATVEGGEATGVPAATLALPAYTLAISVTRGVGVPWRSMVKAVDVLATAPATLLQSTSAINYRMLTNASRQPVLDYAFPASSLAQVQAELDGSRWTVVASTTDLDALAQGHWVESGNHLAAALTPQQCAQAAAAISVWRTLVATLVCNGRLYAADTQGVMTTSRAANPLVTERQCVVTGARLLGLAPVPRSLYSGGFGRYPVYLFTSEGIFALPLTTQGVYGEPRLLSREVLAADTCPVEADRDVYFTSVRGHLCRLRGSEVVVVARAVWLRTMAWDDEHRELWAIDGGQQLWALTTAGHLDRRTTAATHLWGGVGQAVAVCADGTVCDLTTEQAAVLPVEWLSDARPCRKPPRQVTWHVYGDQTALQLNVLGERGVSCHGFVVNRLTVNGRVAAPLPVPLFAPPMRSLRTHVTGTAGTHTLLQCEISQAN
ncbi:MAG: hypothetical protein IJT30_02640 [Muribaculaceae bacterium]|nr:hypothetical protein [Muribaculaceae bacterium]